MTVNMLKRPGPAFLLLACFFALLSGCQRKPKIVLDPKTQEELDRHQAIMDQRDREFELQQEKQRNSVDQGQVQTLLPESTGAMTPAPSVIASRSDTPEPDGVADGRDSAPGSHRHTAFLATGPEETFSGQLTIESGPDEVVDEFLKLLQRGARLDAKRLLTDRAQTETSRAGLELDAPGGMQTRFSIQKTRFATSEKLIAEVDTVFHSTDPATEPIRLTWMLRRQRNGWKVYGMIIRNGKPGLDLLSFENPIDLTRIQQSVGPEEKSSIRSADSSATRDSEIQRK